MTIGIPTNDDEAGLQRLAAQIKAKKVVVKLFLRHSLHAKLYLLFRPDPINPTIGYLGSSNLTLAGLSGQGELNVDVLDHDACRELMRLYMVRRTRSFIQENYAETDVITGRKFITFENGERSYFPSRIPKTVRFPIDDHNPEDQYGRLYTPEVVETINSRSLPRYGLGSYVLTLLHESPSPAETRGLQDLSRAGKRLMGFCRTNLFKRLESSGMQTRHSSAPASG